MRATGGIHLPAAAGTHLSATGGAPRAPAAANLTATKVSPFFAVDLGANFGLSSNEIKMANGFYFEPCFGCDFALSPKQAIYVMLGYNGIGYDYEAFDTTLGSSGYEMRHVLAGKFAIHLGFRF